MSFYDKAAQRRGDSSFLMGFEKTRDFQLNYTSWFSTFSHAMNQSVTTTLQQKTNELFSVAKSSRKNYLKAKNAYEATLAKKGKDVEQEIEAAKNAYLTAGDEAIATLKDTLHEVEMQLLDWMCSYWDVHAEYHLTAAKWVNNIRPQFEGYRTYLRDNLAKHYVAKAARPTRRTPSETPSTKLFGIALAEFLERDGTLLPTVVNEMIDYLLQEAPTMEGVFRLSAMKSTLVQAQQQLDEGHSLPWDDLPDSNLVPALFKQFLRDLPEPLLTFERYEDFLRVNSMEGGESAQCDALRALIQQLPPASRVLCKRLFELLAKVVAHEEVTKMGLGNLSTVLGPNILYTREINPATMIEEMENANGVVALLISQYQEIFPPTSPLWAAQDGDLAALQALIEGGASLDDSVDDQGRTVLHWACIHHHQEMVEYLLSLGSPPPFSLNATDAEGRTALTYCHPSSDQAIQQALLQAGADSPADTAPPSDDSSATRDESTASVSTRTPKLRVSSDELTSPETTPRRSKKSSRRRKSGSSTPSKKDTLKVSRDPSTLQIPTSPKSPLKELPFPREIDSPLTGADLERELNKVMELGDSEDAQPPSDQASKEPQEETSSVACITCLSSLVPVPVSLPSVWTAMNLNDLTTVVHNLTKAALAPSFGPSEIGAVNASLQLCADGLKNLFTLIPQFTAHFSDDDKKDVMAHALTLRSTVRGLIQVVKNLNLQPTQAPLQEDLRSHAKQIVDCVYKFYRACEMACVDGIVSTAQQCSQQVAAFVDQPTPSSEEEGRQACVPLATITLQLTQWVQFQCSTQYYQHPCQSALQTSVSIIGQCTLALLNQALRPWSRGMSWKKEDAETLTEKIESELQHIEELVDRDRQETHLTLREQEEQLTALGTQATALIQQLSQVTFSSDLHKALVLQMKQIRRKMEVLQSLGALDHDALLQAVGEMNEALKKIRVGISALKKDLKDVSIRQRLDLWSESVFQLIQAIRLSIAATVLRLPIEVELQLASQITAVLAVCEDFYRYLASLPQVAPS